MGLANCPHAAVPRQRVQRSAQGGRRARRLQWPLRLSAFSEPARAPLARASLRSWPAATRARRTSAPGPATRCASRRAPPAALTSQRVCSSPSSYAQATHPATGRSRSRARCADLLPRSVLAYGSAPRAASQLSLDPSLFPPWLVRGTANDSGERWNSRPLTS
jgi:hypothetical protein